MTYRTLSALATALVVGVGALSSTVDAQEICPARARGEPRNGSGVNPIGFSERTPAIAGTNWSTTVVLPDLSLGGLLLVGLAPSQGVIKNGLLRGELLTSEPIVCVAASTTGNLTLELPNDCALVGASFFAQALSIVENPPRLVLNNALDVTIGSFTADPSAPGGDDLEFHFRGTKRMLVIIPRFLDMPALFDETPAGEAEAQALCDGAIQALARDSYGKLDLQVDYTWPPVAINRNTDSYAPESALMDVRSDAVQAARRAGYEIGQYDREAILSPSVWGGQSAHGWVRTIWMPHRLPWVLVHEVGHTLSRGHADFWDGDPVGAGVKLDQGDLYDPMGSPTLSARFHHANPYFKHRSGWLADSEILTVDQPGTYTLAPIEGPDPTVGPVALRIRRDEDTTYWIFHRATEPLVDSGALILRASNNPFDSTLLLDMKRGTLVANEVDDAALGMGQIFDDTAFAGILVENISLDGGPVTLNITVDVARQQALDLRPKIDVLYPLRDRAPVEGRLYLEVVAYDPDVSELNGSGISGVTLEILAPTSDPFELIDSVVLTQPPYAWTFDTTSGETPDALYYLSVTALAADGGSTTSWQRMVFENGPPLADFRASVSAGSRRKR